MRILISTANFSKNSLLGKSLINLYRITLAFQTHIMPLNNLTGNIFTIDNFWTQQECIDFISKSEEIGYEPATVETEKRPVVVETVRNNNRAIY